MLLLAFSSSSCYNWIGAVLASAFILTSITFYCFIRPILFAQLSHFCFIYILYIATQKGTDIDAKGFRSLINSHSRASPRWLGSHLAASFFCAFLQLVEFIVFVLPSVYICQSCWILARYWQQGWAKFRLPCSEIFEISSAHPWLAVALPMTSSTTSHSCIFTMFVKLSLYTAVIASSCVNCSRRFPSPTMNFSCSIYQSLLKNKKTTAREATLTKTALFHTNCRVLFIFIIIL